MLLPTTWINSADRMIISESAPAHTQAFAAVFRHVRVRRFTKVYNWNCCNCSGNLCRLNALSGTQSKHWRQKQESVQPRQWQPTRYATVPAIIHWCLSCFDRLSLTIKAYRYCVTFIHVWNSHSCLLLQCTVHTSGADVWRLDLVALTFDLLAVHHQVSTG